MGYLPCLRALLSSFGSIQILRSPEGFVVMTTLLTQSVGASTGSIGLCQRHGIDVIWLTRDFFVFFSYGIHFASMSRLATLGEMVFFSTGSTAVGQIDAFLHRIYKYVAMAHSCLVISSLLPTPVFNPWCLRTVFFTRVCYYPWLFVLLLLRTDQVTLSMCRRLCLTCKCQYRIEALVVVVATIACAFWNLCSLIWLCFD